MVQGVKINHYNLKVDVGTPCDDDWVCIGGGGRGSASPGNMLTASYPSDDFKSWDVSSRNQLEQYMYYDAPDVTRNIVN